MSMQARQRRNVKAKAPHVTIVHKANILGVTDGLFLDCCKEVAKEFPDIPWDSQVLDPGMGRCGHMLENGVVGALGRYLPGIANPRMG